MGNGTGYVFDERMLLHVDPENEHPESPARLIGIMDRLKKVGVLDRLQQVIPTTHHVFDNAHSPEHVSFVKNLKDEICNQLDSMYLCPQSGEAAQCAVDCTVSIAKQILNGNLRNGFAVVRPPGHHAEPNERSGLVKRIMIVDWDVHHGNGTQKMFVSDPDVLYVSLHRYDQGSFYPCGSEGNSKFIGEGAGIGKSVNIAWNGVGLGDGDYLYAFTRIIMPIAWEFQPEIVIVSAGFDAAMGDPIGECNLTSYGYAQMTHLLSGLASGKLLLVLEGGYNVDMISVCAEACIRVLLGEAMAIAEPASLRPCSVALQAVSATTRAQSPYWKCLLPVQYTPEIVDGPVDGVVSLQSVMDIYWRHVCQKSLRLIPLPITNPTLREYFHQSVHISHDFMKSPRVIFVIAHESGTLYSSNLEMNNLVESWKGTLLYPFHPYIHLAQSRRWAIMDIKVNSRLWKLKQVQVGSSEDINRLNELLLYCWDNYISRSGAAHVFVIGTGLPSYSLLNLVDKRPIESLVRSVVIMSPTLFLPIASTEKASWYSLHSRVFVPTSRTLGSPIKTNTAFGNCFSAGSEEPLEMPSVITRLFPLVMTHFEDLVDNYKRSFVDLAS